METKSFTPVWHPSVAASRFTLSNDLNNTNNNILYYDTTTEFIEFPKVFKYNRINSTGGLKLSRVVTNSNSSNPTYSSTLPSTSGTFTINKIAPDNGSTAPTIDLYCVGDIQIVKTYDIDNHSYGEVVITSISPSTYDASNNNYSLNRSLTINYYTNYGFGDGYEYSRLWVKATVNWGKDSNGNFISSGTANSNGTLTLNAPSSFVSNVVPTITMWMQLYSKQSSGGGGGGDDSWEATAVGNHATYDESTGNYISLFNGTSVSVYGVSGNSRHCSWEVWTNWSGQYDWTTVSAWIDKNWIDPSDNPN